MNSIRNFCIIAHIDHGKSTLADRLLELTGSIEARKMQAQVLDTMDLEREHGITIKLQPARMSWLPRMDADLDKTRMDADEKDSGSTQVEDDKRSELLYEDLTYKIRGAVFRVHNQLGSGHKESVYQNALEEEFEVNNIPFEKEKTINVTYLDKKIGTYRPDYVVDNKIIVELKTLPFLGNEPKKQLWYYLKGSDYKLALLINFGTSKVEIERVVYDIAREKISVHPRANQRPSDPISVHQRNNPRPSAYLLNLIDTPGHVDFSYEVSRSLAAVEGALLVVDASQGVQAQTLANLHMAQKHDLALIPVINKIDLPSADTQEVIAELNALKIDFVCPPILVSAKTGENVAAVLDAIVQYIPAPKGNADDATRALVFDSYFDPYRGVIAYVRLVDGSLSKGDKITFIQTGKESEALEVGAVCVGLHPSDRLECGQIGYIVTSLKEVAGARVGDTITTKLKVESEKWKVRGTESKSRFSAPATCHLPPVTVPLSGYKQPQAMVYAGLFSASGEGYEKLRDALTKLKLNDASLQYEPITSTAFGFGFRAGFLGLLHLEIIKERLEREYNLDLVVTIPTVAYKKSDKYNVPSGKCEESSESMKLATCHLPPVTYHPWEEPWVKIEIISSQESLGQVMQLVANNRGLLGDVNYLGGRVILSGEMPLGEVIVNFYDKLKAATSGYGSLSYDIIGYRPADLVELDILVAEEKVDALSRLVPRVRVAGEARRVVEKLKELVPKQNFEVKLQAAVGGKILAAERITPFRKDVTAKLYGGDVTRKRKLLEKQKKGKRKMATLGRVEVPTSVFVKLLKY